MIKKKKEGKTKESQFNIIILSKPRTKIKLGDNCLYKSRIQFILLKYKDKNDLISFVTMPNIKVILKLSP